MGGGIPIRRSSVEIISSLILICCIFLAIRSTDVRNVKVNCRGEKWKKTMTDESAMRKNVCKRGQCRIAMTTEEKADFVFSVVQ